jgi:hypothetical protein
MKASLYIRATESGFYTIHTDSSFDPICGYMTEKRDALRARDVLEIALSDADTIYRCRETLAQWVASLRWDVMELSDHKETRARASSLRDLCDLAESRLLSVTRP